MAKDPAAPGGSRLCAQCQRELTFVASWTFRGRWGYEEVQTYECATHGPIFIAAQIATGAGASHRIKSGPENGDRDSLIPARRRPAPSLDSDVIALPEPDTD